MKMFNKASYMRPREVQERELEMMLKLKHQNVVRLLAIEQEVRFGVCLCVVWSSVV